MRKPTAHRQIVGELIRVFPPYAVAMHESLQGLTLHRRTLLLYVLSGALGMTWLATVPPTASLVGIAALVSLPIREAIPQPRTRQAVPG